MLDRIAIDLETYYSNSSGIHTYIASFIPCLLAEYPDIEWTFFACSNYTEELAKCPFGKADNINYVALPHGHWMDRLYYFTLDCRNVEKYIGKHDVYHSPTTPGFSTNGLYVVTVHDLAWMRFNQFYPQRAVWTRHMGLGRDIRRAGLILADSESTKNDLIELKGVDADRIHVVLLGVSDKFASERDPELVKETLDRLGVRQPFVLTIPGTHCPRKNLARLTLAMSRVKETMGNVQLLVPGEALLDFREFEETVASEKLEDMVVRPGHLSEDELLNVMCAARVMAFPSLYEGFGLPILEAMSAGVPVVTSNVSSMPEIAGDAALLVDPRNVEEIADSIVRLLGDDALRAELSRKGVERASTFSWERAAREIMAMYRLAAGEG